MEHTHTYVYTYIQEALCGDDSLLILHVEDAMEKREASLNLSVLVLSAVERRLRFFLLGASFQREELDM